jgi:hypothetical protein
LSADIGAETSSDPLFRALLVDGRTIAGRLVSLGPGAIRLSSAERTEHDLALGRLIKLTRDVPIAQPSADRSHLVFPGGDFLSRVVIGASTDTNLEVQSDALGKLSLPLESLLGLILSAPSQTGELDLLWDRLRTLPRTTEVVWLANGDRMTGEFLGLDERKVKIQVANKPVEVDRAGVLAIGFNPALVNYRRPKSDFLEMTLKDGTRLGVSGAKLEEGTVQGMSRFGQTVRFPLGELARVHARTTDVVYLTEREPERIQYASYVGPTRPVRFDRTADGHLFQLAGQIYDRGIGTQSYTVMAYALQPGDRRFQAMVGVDERAGPLGSVVFRVMLDGKERQRTAALTDHDPPQTIDLDLAGAKYLFLITEFGDRGNVRDLADWVEARIIR